MNMRKTFIDFNAPDETSNNSRFSLLSIDNNNELILIKDGYGYNKGHKFKPAKAGEDSRVVVVGRGLTEITLQDETDNFVIFSGSYREIERIFECSSVENEYIDPPSEEKEQPIHIIEKVEVHTPIIGPRGERGDSGMHGMPGDAGKDGSKGEQGDAGKDGSKGEQGDVGPKGDKGEQGDVGPKGDKGEDGKFGPPGNQGKIGPRGKQGEDGKDGIKGKQGPKGDKGDVGPAGKAGPRGSVGDDGPEGEIGPKGKIGPRGEKGERGYKGDQGEPGILKAQFPLKYDTSQKTILLDTKTLNKILTIPSGQHGPDWPAMNDWLAAGGGAVGVRYEDNRLIKSVEDINFTGSGVSVTRYGNNRDIQIDIDGSKFSYGDTTPSSPHFGDRWYETDRGLLYTFVPTDPETPVVGVGIWVEL